MLGASAQLPCWCRNFYLAEDAGRAKATAAAKKLLLISNRTAKVEGLDMQLSEPSHVQQLVNILRRETAPSMVLCCGSSSQSEICNEACLQCKLPWFEARIDESGFDWSISKMNPGLGACYECVPPPQSQPLSNPNLKQLEELPRMANSRSLAWMLVQEVMKHLVGGSQEFFSFQFSATGVSSRDMRPNPFCTNKLCITLQDNPDLEPEEQEEEVVADMGDDDQGIEDPDVIDIRRQRKLKQRQMGIIPLEEITQWVSEEAAPLPMFAPSTTIFPTSAMLKNKLNLDFDHSYPANAEPVSVTKITRSELREVVYPAPSPNYPREEYLASASDPNLMESKSGTVATAVPLYPLYIDKADVDYEETMTFAALIPEEVYA